MGYKPLWNEHDQYPPKKVTDPAPRLSPKVFTIEDVFPRLDHWAIGFDEVFGTLKSLTINKNGSYPPYDLVKVGDNANILDIAVAGFAKSEISVVVQDSVLTIIGKKDTERAGEVIHKGIANRDFELRFAMAEFWEVDRASLEDGMLTVTFARHLPKEKQPKVIDIK